MLAGGVGTVSGFGTSTIMVPVMLMYLPLPQTLLFVGVIHWFGDIWKLALFREGVRWKLLLGFGVPGIVFSFVGALLAVSAPEELMARVLGGFLLVYVAFLLLRSGFRLRDSLRIQVVGGTLSGLLAGIFGVGGAVRGAFLTAFDLPKAVYIATSGGIALAVDSTRLITYVAEGTRLPSSLLWGMLAFVPASLIGAELAKRAVDRIAHRHFRTVIAGLLLAAGLKLVIWP